MSLAPKAVPAWAKPLVEQVQTHHEKLEGLETVYKEITEATAIIKKIWAAIKYGAPTIISAAVTAGYINGDFGKLLRAIFG